MKSILKILLFCFFSVASPAQNEDQKWYFGAYAGLDFSTNPPTALSNGTLLTNEGSASISDAQGHLLFYTDGVTVYNKVHAVMANGSGLNGHDSSTQSALIIKKPCSTDIYYVFTLDEMAGPAGLCYSEVNMSLAAGMGSVSVKNFSLQSPSCEKITAAKHCNGADIWVVTHDWNSNCFRTYLVTSSGINLVPVISCVGNTVNGNVAMTIGQMKISPDRKKLGLAISAGTPQNPGPFEVYDFNPASGTISNPLVLGSFPSSYGCEFSPDGSKFYGSTYLNQLIQWNLSAGSPQAIIASQYILPTHTVYKNGQLQLGPDGKIYLSRPSCYGLAVINFPDLTAPNFNYVDSAQSLGSSMCMLGLPNFMKQSAQATPGMFTHSVHCGISSFTAPAFQNTLSPLCSFADAAVNSVLWNFGDILSDSNSTSILNPSHSYSSPGTYTITLLLNHACTTDTIRSVVTITSVPTLSVGGSFTMCTGENRVFTASGASSYTWSNGSNAASISVSPTISTGYFVSSTGSNSCQGNKTFTVTVNKCAGLSQAESNSSFRIYPNPTNGNLVFIETDKPVQVELINQLGEMLFETSLESGKHPLNISGLNKGVYFLKLISPSEKQITRLIKTD